MSLQLKLVFISNIYLAYACKQELGYVVGGNVCVWHAESEREITWTHLKRLMQIIKLCI